MSKSPSRKLSRKHEFYLYVLLDPRKPGPFYYGHWKFSHEPFYVGKGTGGRSLTTLFDTHNPFKARKIAKMRREGFEPKIEIKRKELTEKQAFNLEIELIFKIGRYNRKEGPLTNLTDGGDGISGHVHSKETRRQLRKAHTGKKQTAEHVANMKKAITGLKRSPEARANISRASTGK